MTPELLIKDLRKKICSQIDLIGEGENRYRIFTPFQFFDGDHFAIVLKKENDSWIITDEGHTLMHLTYSINEKDLYKGNRYEIIRNALSYYNVEDFNGAYMKKVPDEAFGDTLFNYIQALMKISDVEYLSEDRVKSTFMEDFHQYFKETVPKNRIKYNWFFEDKDPNGMYRTDCYINGMKTPLLVYALSSDEKTRDATISLLNFEKWGKEFRSMGIFEDQEKISRGVLARFTDVCEKQYSSLASNKDRINKYIRELIAQS